MKYVNILKFPRHICVNMVRQAGMQGTGNEEISTTLNYYSAQFENILDLHKVHAENSTIVDSLLAAVW